MLAIVASATSGQLKQVPIGDLRLPGRGPPRRSPQPADMGAASNARGSADGRQNHQGHRRGLVLMIVVSITADNSVPGCFPHTSASKLATRTAPANVIAAAWC